MEGEGMPLCELSPLHLPPKRLNHREATDQGPSCRLLQGHLAASEDSWGVTRGAPTHGAQNHPTLLPRPGT